MPKASLAILMAEVGAHVPANSSTWEFSPVGKFAGWARNCAVAGTAEFKSVASARGAPTRGYGRAKVIGLKFVLILDRFAAGSVRMIHCRYHI